MCHGRRGHWRGRRRAGGDVELERGGCRLPTVVGHGQPQRESPGLGVRVRDARLEPAAPLAPGPVAERERVSRELAALRRSRLQRQPDRAAASAGPVARRLTLGFFGLGFATAGPGATEAASAARVSDTASGQRRTVFSLSRSGMQSGGAGAAQDRLTLLGGVSRTGQGIGTASWPVVQAVLSLRWSASAAPPRSGRSGPRRWARGVRPRSCSDLLISRVRDLEAVRAEPGA
jgi:hypothetical protein